MRWQQVLFYSAKDLEKDELDITYDRRKFRSLTSDNMDS